MLGSCLWDERPAKIETVSVSEVQSEIKYQVGVYMLAAQLPVFVNINKIPTVVSGNPEFFWCGDGSLNFDIASIKVELRASVDTTAGATVGLSIPVPLITVGPSLSLKGEGKNETTYDYQIWPVDFAEQTDFKQTSLASDAVGKSAIAQALLSLRQGMVEAALNVDPSTGSRRPPQPCFTAFNPNDPKAELGDTVKFALDFTRTVNGSVTIKIAALSVGPSASQVSVTGHTLTAVFVPSALKPFQKAAAAVTAACSPDSTSLKCKLAQAERDDAIRHAQNAMMAMKLRPLNSRPQTLPR